MNSKRARSEVLVLQNLAEAVRSVYAQSVLNCIDKDAQLDFAKFTSLPSVHPSAYDNSRDFAYDYAIQSYLRKWSAGADKKALEEKALKTFQDVESAVAVTNRKLMCRSGVPGVEGAISAARRKIIDILGFRDSGDFPFEEFAESCGWGKGATYSLRAKAARLDKKLLEPRLSVTQEALPLAIAMLEWDSSWMSARVGVQITGPYCVLPEANFEVVPGGRFTTVDKDYRSRRGIDVQPTVNLYLQKGLGMMLRKRLKRFGIDLDDQSRNQRLAALANSEGYATIDLASASDTIATELVRLFMPPNWYSVLDALRTRRIVLKKGAKPIPLQKFSAMGNGFTFELESLLFYAICHCVVRVDGADSESSIAVYGDDLIVHQRHAVGLIHLLTELGFTVNVEKSFTEGRFYESCGKHYFDGIDVTPPYQKEEVNSLPSSIRAANRILRWAARMGRGVYFDGIAYNSWRTALNEAEYQAVEYGRLRDRTSRRLHGGRRPKRSKRPLPPPRMPYGYDGDGALIDPGFVPSTDVHGTFEFSELVEVAVKQPANEYALLAISLKRGVVSDSPFCGKTAVRGETRLVLNKRRVWRLIDEVPLWASNFDKLAA